jgi:hypothetical protein
MKFLFAKILVAILLLTFASAPHASANIFDFFVPKHTYRHHGHIYHHRAWVPPNRGFAGYYRYW